MRILCIVAMLCVLAGLTYAQSPPGSGPQGTIPQTTYSTLPTGSSSSSSGALTAAPIMGLYFGGPNACSPSNIGSCYNTFADTQLCNGGAWTSGSPTVTCGLTVGPVNGSVTTNVATYVIPFGVPAIPTATWLVGQSVTIVGFTGSDTFFNQTCTISTVSASQITCPLTHANASSSSPGTIQHNTVGPFVASDVGKRLFGYQTARSFQNLNPGNNNNLPITTGTALTISAFVSSNQVTLNGNAGATVASGGSIAYGHPDDAAAATMETAMQTLNYCPLVHFAAANYMFTDWHFTKNTPACELLSTLINASLNGNIFYHAGIAYEGRGMGTTNIYLTPGFPETLPCTNGISGKGCFVIPTQGSWNNLRISGLGNYNSSNPAAGPYLVEVNGPATIEKVVLENWGAGIGTGGGLANDSICLYTEYWVQIQQVDISGCGSIHYGQNQGSYVNATRLSVDNQRVWGMAFGLGGTLLGGNTPPTSYFDNYNMVCYECRVFGGNNLSAAATAGIVNQNAQALKFYHLAATYSPNTTSGGIGYDCLTANGLLDAEDSIFDYGANAGAATNTSAIINASVACTTKLKGTTLSSNGGTGNTYSDGSASSFLWDLGSNTLAPNLFNVLGTIIADGRSLRGICTGVGTAASTLALRISGTSTTGTGIPTTCTSTTLDAGMPMTQARTVSTMQVKATAAGTNASSGVVTVLKNGVATAITCTIGTGTSCNDFTHTVAFVAGDLLSMQFTTQAADTLAGVNAQVMWQ